MSNTLDSRINQNLSKAFDLLRFPLAILVVYLHIAPVFNPWDTPADVNPVYFHINRTICLIAACAVPTFFFISAYLISYKTDKLTLQGYKSVLIKRFLTLFVPYLIWNLISCGYLAATHQLEGMPTLGFVFLRPANFPLWFIRNLIVLVILYPVFILFAKFTKKAGFIVISCLFVISPFFGTLQYLDILTMRSLFFFYFGIYAGWFKRDADRISTMSKWGIIVVWLLIFFTELFGSSTLSIGFINLYLLFGCMSFVLLANETVRYYRYSIPPVLASATYFIYLTHKIGPTYISKQIVSLLPMNETMYEIVVFLFAPIITVCICVYVYMLLKRLIPNAFKYLTGGR